MQRQERDPGKPQDGYGQLIMGIPKLAGELVMHLVRSFKGDIGEVLSRVDTSNHETGHAVIGILNGWNVVKMHVSSLPWMVNAHLGRPQGAVLQQFEMEELMRVNDHLGGPQGATTVHKNSDHNWVAKTLLATLGGVAYEYLDNYVITNDQKLEDVMRKNGGAADYQKVEQMLSKIFPDKEKRLKIINYIFNELTSFYKHPEVAKMMNALSNALVIKRKFVAQDKTVNQQLERIITDEGVTLDEIETLYNALLERIKVRLNEARWSRGDRGDI